MKSENNESLVAPETSAPEELNYRTLVDVLDEGILAQDVHGVIYACNESAERILGLTREEIMGRSSHDPRWKTIHPDGSAFAPDEHPPIVTLRSGEPCRNIVMGVYQPDGTLRWLSVNSNPLFRAGEKVPYAVVTSFVDITAMRQTAAALQASEQRMLNIISSAMDAIISVDATQRVVLFNPAAELMFGRKASEALGKSLEEFIPARFRKSHHQHVDKFGHTNTTKRTMGALGAVYGLRSNGEEFPVEASISQTASGTEKLYTVILRDITQRRETEARLHEQASLLNQAKEAIISCDLDGRVLFWNQGAAAMYGWSVDEVLGQNLHQLLFHEELAPLKDIHRDLFSKGEWFGELRQYTKADRPISVDSHYTLVYDNLSKPKSIFIISTDITERKKIEAQFLRAQRMESIGTLAGGIAHDLNNILSPILMAVQMLQLKVSDPTGQRMLEIMRTNAERGGELVKQILSFARGVSGERVAIHVKHLLKEIVKILQETMPKAIDVVLTVDPDLALVSGDATQLHQVLMNLCINARDAMPTGGTLRLEAHNIIIDGTYAEMMPDAVPGKFVQIVVSDSGTGIAPENVTRIFDPFFTTKEIGQGTGLGLSTVLGIVKGHSGFINVYSELGIGTQFRVYLPLLEISALHTPEPEAPQLPQGKGEMILVVDDELAIREITKNTLESFNYRILTASNGAEAVALFVQHQPEIQLVLTDMMMPIMDGPALIHALRRLNPAIKIIASSGLPDNAKVIESADLKVSAFLAKPYTTDKLLNALTNALAQ